METYFLISCVSIVEKHVLYVCVCLCKVRWFTQNGVIVDGVTLHSFMFIFYYLIKDLH